MTRCAIVRQTAKAEQRIHEKHIPNKSKATIHHDKNKSEATFGVYMMVGWILLKWRRQRGDESHSQAWVIFCRV